MVVTTREAMIGGFLVAIGLWLRLDLVSHHWLFAGADSYGYLNIADEWGRHHRIAFGPFPIPLEWYRRPLYPAFLNLAKGYSFTKSTGGAGWTRIQVAQIVLEASVLWPVVYVAARRLGGITAAVLALAIATCFPPMVLYSGAVLTESMAAIAAAVAVLPLLGYQRNWRASLIWSALGAAASSLLRPDGFLWVTALLPILFARAAPSGSRVRMGAAYAVVFVLSVSPWFARNLVQFGQLHVADGMIDRVGNDVPYYRGFWDWMRTWASDERASGYPVAGFYDRLAPVSTDTYAVLGAFDAPATNAEDERRIVTAALEERRKDGVTRRVSDAFAALAAARTRAHPIRVLILLPLERAMRMWLAPQMDLAAQSELWPLPLRALKGTLPYLGAILLFSTLIGALALLVVAEQRVHCLILLTPLVARSLALGWTGFSLARYVVPSFPIAFVLTAAGLVTAAAQIKSIWVHRRNGKE